MRIGIDIDDTITNSWEYMIPFHSKMFGVSEEKLSERKPYYRSVSDVVTLEQYLEWLKVDHDEIAMNIPLRDDVKFYLDKIREDGNEIIFITARGKAYNDPMKLTEEYLKKHDIKYDKLIVNAKDKSISALSEKIDLFIDDSVFHCKEVFDVGVDVLLFEREYNKDCNDFKRVNSWAMVYDYIQKVMR